MNRENKGIFLSYAHEDAGPARRMADALRGFGLEVWFDQSELRGGEAWDAKIRRQIRECALFVAVISQHTQARGEGYFRREWKLAVERMADMAADQPFLVPVVIDDTTEAVARVPEEFLRVQWMRLPGGAPSPHFVEQVRRLLDGTAFVAAPGGQRTSASAEDREDRGRTISEPKKTKPSQTKWVAAAAVLAVVAIGGFFALRPATKTGAVASVPAPSSLPALRKDEGLPAPGKADISSKSIAVLPFANLSDDTDASAFFSDGIHEDILTNLSNIRQLRVVSRTSVLGYRSTTKKMAEIAKELGVAYILEGSVRRAGNKVRVTGQLIRAATDEHLWAKNYDRDLTDIFAIQSELSQAIAGELKAAISPEEKKQLEQRPTQNIAAYELVLKARRLVTQESGGFNTANATEAAALLEAAVKLDPSYFLAYAELVYTYGYYSRIGGPPADERMANFKKAKNAIEAATRLAPSAPEVIRAMGDYYYYAEQDFGRAMAEYQKVSQMRPNEPGLLNRVGSIQRRQARWAESVATWKRLEEIDPADARNVRDIGINLAAGHRYAEAIRQARRFTELLPTDVAAGFELAYLSYLATGSTREAEQFFARLTDTPSPASILARKRWVLRTGNFDEALRLDRDATPGSAPAIEMAALLASRGDWPAARVRLGNLLAQTRIELGKDAENATAWRNAAAYEALLGNKEEALRCARKAVQLVPESRDAVIGAQNRAWLAFVYTWCGEKDAAVAELAHCLRAPYASLAGVTLQIEMNVHVLRHDPRFFPLRGHPGFEALLKDPKNNAPLF